MPRNLRAAAQAAAQSLKETPQTELSDEEMQDVESSAATPKNETPEQDAAETPEKPSEQPPAPETDEAATTTTPAQETEEASKPETPIHSAGRGSAIRGKRRPGRPPKIRPPDYDAPEGSERAAAPTPQRRRGRGRPSAGGRWGRGRGGPSHVTQVPIDKEGNMMNVINDEVDLPEDPEGETKVDKMGNLLGGRDYRVRTFTVRNRGDRLYMLSTEPARCIGFRDSYLFFQKHKMLFKIIIEEDEKYDLIEREIIPHSYKGRAIGVVTARSVFREFGAKIVIGGRKVTDDYFPAAALERGDVEGELAVPDDVLPGPGETYDRNRYVAWFGASQVYHSGVPTVPIANGKVADTKKKKVPVTNDNWMLEHARAASAFNSSLTKMRELNLEGQYDIHTNTMHYPQNTQPTHAKWDKVPSETPSSSHYLDSSNSKATLINDINGRPMKVFREPPEEKDESPTLDDSNKPTTIFPPVASAHSDRFFIEDVYYETPSETYMGSGPDPDLFDEETGELVQRTNTDPTKFTITPEVFNELPPECQAAYREAAMRKRAYLKQWKNEQEDGLRARLPNNYTWIH